MELIHYQIYRLKSSENKLGFGVQFNQRWSHLFEQLKAVLAQTWSDTLISCSTAHEAENRIERISDKHAGVIAISQEYDPATGEYDKLTILAK